MFQGSTYGQNKANEKAKVQAYSDSKASDDEKVRRNWNKAKGLFDRREFSVAILRCGTCLELSVNAAIRKEVIEKRKLPPPFVDKLLKGANGLHNKYQNIYLPIMENYEQHKDLKRLWSSHIVKIKKERNAVAHGGEFRSKSVAEDILQHTYEALDKIMKLHGYTETIKPFRKRT